jgi:hypothetical protein
MCTVNKARKGAKKVSREVPVMLHGTIRAAAAPERQGDAE